MVFAGCNLYYNVRTNNAVRAGISAWHCCAYVAFNNSNLTDQAVDVVTVLPA